MEKANTSNVVGVVYERPWGTYQTLLLEKHYQVKKLVIHPKGQLSLQKHAYRDEHWTIVEGQPTITLGSTQNVYRPNQTVFIPKETVHRASNFTETPCVIIEVQYGHYLGEDDIVRLEDVYGRQKTENG